MGLPLRLALAGGGTGGHIVPGLHLLAAAGEEQRVADVLWFTSGRAVEQRALAGLLEARERPPVERVVLDLEPPGGGAPSLLRLGSRTPANVLRARAALKRHRSEVLLALGGFTGLPAALAARSLGVPVALLEINAAPGRATRALSVLAARVFHAWGASLPAGGEDAKHLRVGPPLPPALFEGERPEGGDARVRAALGFDPDRPLLLVLGGSQGAGSLNAFVARALDELLSGGLAVLHQTGPGRTDETAEERAGYRRVEYLTDVPAALRAATLVLCRGGASTLAELAATGTPALVVPYPHHPDRHQERNARELGAGVRIVQDAELGDATVRELLRLAAPDAAAERARMGGELRAAVPADAAARILRELGALRV